MVHRIFPCLEPSMTPADGWIRENAMRCRGQEAPYNPDYFHPGDSPGLQDCLIASADSTAEIMGPAVNNGLEVMVYIHSANTSEQKVREEFLTVSENSVNITRIIADMQAGSAINVIDDGNLDVYFPGATRASASATYSGTNAIISTPSNGDIHFKGIRDLVDSSDETQVFFDDGSLPLGGYTSRSAWCNGGGRIRTATCACAGNRQ